MVFFNQDRIRRSQAHIAGMKRANHKINPVSRRLPASRSRSARSGKWHSQMVMLVILAATFFMFFPSLRNNSLVWDDEGYILTNQIVRNFELPGILSDFVMGNYHPATVFTLALEYQFFGTDAAGYHAVNLLLHLINVVLVFYVLSLLSQKKEVALISALLFGIHPLHVESVAWASGVKDLLFTLFFLASLIYYVKYLNSPERKFILISLVFFFFSLLSKAMAAPLPVLLLLTDYYTGRKINGKVLAEKIPFFMLSLIFGIIAILAQRSADSVPESTFPFFQRVVFACFGFVTYLIKLVLPFNLSAFYPYPVKSGGTIPAIYYSYIFLTALVAVLVYFSSRYSKKIPFGSGFFLLTIILVLQLFPVGSAIIADRYSYLSSIAILYLVAEGIVFLWSRKQKIFAIGILSLFSVFYSAKTYSRCKVWENNLTLWTDVIEIGRAHV